jgi:acyl-[acyl-carrier-protein]-phospholipid O-acyltransferase/long-chain-fatty-acid--[acyl-carrier-protein] ligase
MAWGYFYLLAGLALLSIPEYTLILQISREQASRLLAIMAITIGLGSATAGWISGPRIEPRLAPIGAAGLTLFFVLLGLVPPAYENVAAFILGAGFFAGFYIIPLQALMQKLSPADERGRFLGTANAISFGFFSLASVLYWLIRPLFDTPEGPGPGGPPQRVFLISAALMAGGALFFVIRLRRLIYRRAPVIS